MGIVMKYIRTKDGIYKATKINGTIVARGGVAYSCNIADVHFPIVFKEKDIIKQADTIEELCDELIFDNVYHSRMTPSAMHTKENQEVIKNYLKQNITCYGAIWTDKGLIYVAKMNDKGDLELL